MCINSIKGRFTTDRSGKCFISTNICTSRKNILFCFSFSIVNDVLACWTLHQHHCTYLTGPSNKIFVRILLAFNSCYVILIEWTFYYFVMCKCMSTTVYVNGTVQFTFLLVMRLNTVIVTSCDSLIVILAPQFFHH